MRITVKSRVVNGLLTGHNTLIRHLHLMGLPYVGGVEHRMKPLLHILCEWESLASLRHVYLGSFFLDPEDIQSLSLGAIWNFSDGAGLP